MKNELIHKHQFGFTRGSSTAAAVLHMTNFLSTNLDGGGFNAVMFLDIRKAFDCISHPILLRKLSKLGLQQNELSILQTFLTGRTQFVKVNGMISRILTSPDAGIPQGTRVGPSLFNFCNNDIFSLDLYGQIQGFADDTALKYRASSLEQIRTDMSHDLVVLQDWFRNNRLTLNVDKTKFMVFSRGHYGAAIVDVFHFDLKWHNAPIQKVRTFNYLGLLIDEQLRWDSHVEKVKSVISPYVFVLKRSRHFLQEKTSKMIYSAYIASRISYVAPAWKSASMSHAA